MAKMPLRRSAASVAVLAATAALFTTPAEGVEPARPKLTDSWKLYSEQELASGVVLTRYVESSVETGRAKSAGGRLLNIVRINPTLGVIDVDTTFGAEAVVAEKVSEQLEAVRPKAPVAGINGGYFVPEDPISERVQTLNHLGLAAQDGVLHSASCFGGSMGAFLQYGVPYITKAKTSLTLSATGDSVEIDDINRNLGLFFGCASTADDKAVQENPNTTFEEKHYMYDPDEVVLFTSDYGAPTPTKAPLPADPAPNVGDPGFPPASALKDREAEVEIDDKGVVVADAATTRGGRTIRAKHRVLQGIGTGADWILKYGKKGAVLTVDEKLTDTRTGQEITLDPSLDIVNGIHELVHSDAPAVTAAAKDSCHEVRDSNGTQVTANRRDTGDVCLDDRTAIGVNAYGHTLLVTLTDQTSGVPVRNGGYLDEFAKLLMTEEIAAVDALNLDGGGSTTLLAKGDDMTPPIHPAGGGAMTYRPVANAVHTGAAGFVHTGPLPTP
ncbi:phosphodiester glycosidase family protein [Streptomyces exfoliatus]|uniref:Phosphodiester glycosidase family protein n=1 Tax=Streptomyces exfoliatus TaxID=1905 RepID=A0ABV3D5R8_STREX